MNFLIVYGTRYGMTRLTAETMGEWLQKENKNSVIITDYKISKKIRKQINSFDLIIAGSFIVSSRWKGGVKRFLKKYGKDKKLALFVTAGGTLYHANERGQTKEEAIERAKQKYILPVVEKYGLKPTKLGVFGGQYKKRKKVKYNNWNKDDIITWIKEF